MSDKELNKLLGRNQSIFDSTIIQGFGIVILLIILFFILFI